MGNALKMRVAKWHGHGVSATTSLLQRQGLHIFFINMFLNLCYLSFELVYDIDVTHRLNGRWRRMSCFNFAQTIFEGRPLSSTFFVLVLSFEQNFIFHLILGVLLSLRWSFLSISMQIYCFKCDKAFEGVLHYGVFSEKQKKRERILRVL